MTSEQRVCGFEQDIQTNKDKSAKGAGGYLTLTDVIGESIW